MECLLTDKVCSNTNKKCKECIFDECKGVINMIEKQEKKRREMLMNKLKKQLPEQCKKCGMLEIININKGEVRCFYKIKDKCMLE